MFCFVVFVVFPLLGFLKFNLKKNDGKKETVRPHEGTICTAHKNTLFSLDKVENLKKKKKHSVDACANWKPTSCSVKFLHSRQSFRRTFFSLVYGLDCW